MKRHGRIHPLMNQAAAYAVNGAPWGFEAEIDEATLAAEKARKARVAAMMRNRGLGQPEAAAPKKPWSFANLRRGSANIQPVKADSVIIMPANDHMVVELPGGAEKAYHQAPYIREDDAADAAVQTVIGKSHAEKPVHVNTPLSAEERARKARIAALLRDKRAPVKQKKSRALGFLSGMLNATAAALALAVGLMAVSPQLRDEARNFFNPKVETVDTSNTVIRNAPLAEAQAPLRFTTPENGWTNPYWPRTDFSRPFDFRLPSEIERDRLLGQQYGFGFDLRLPGQTNPTDAWRLSPYFGLQSLTPVPAVKTPEQLQAEATEQARVAETARLERLQHVREAQLRAAQRQRAEAARLARIEQTRLAAEAALREQARLEQQRLERERAAATLDEPVADPVVVTRPEARPVPEAIVPAVTGQGREVATCHLREQFFVISNRGLRCDIKQTTVNPNDYGWFEVRTGHYARVAMDPQAQPLEIATWLANTAPAVASYVDQNGTAGLQTRRIQREQNPTPGSP